MKWYIRTRKGEFGPLRISDLAMMVREGELVGSDSVRDEGGDAWRSAESIVRLFLARTDVGDGSSRFDRVAQAPKPTPLQSRNKGNISKKASTFRWPISANDFFRVMVTLVAANLVGLSILQFAEADATKFPDITSANRKFPLRGKCSPNEFLVLLIASMSVAGIAGYGIAGKLAGFADD